MTIDKLDATTPDLTRQNIARLAELFPECVTEGVAGTASDGGEPVIDFDLLRQALADHLVEGPQERYRLDWPGKRRALLTANAPIDKTLRPMRDDSVDFDTTRNLFIEGDNLDALKLLQETYLGKVKMIYIDPPYNTGKDFIYKDKFAQSRENYEAESGQRDEEGGRLVINSESNGRFHSDWLSMIYPRLKLARNLLRDDGVVVFSIDESERANAQKVLDDVFGEKSFVGEIIWKNSSKNDQDYISIQHEYILFYVKSRSSNKGEWLERKPGLDRIYDAFASFKRVHGADWKAIHAAALEWYRSFPASDPVVDSRHYSWMDARGVYFASDLSGPNPGQYVYDLTHSITKQPCKMPASGWRYPKDEMYKRANDGLIHFGDDHTTVPQNKTYLKDVENQSLSSVRFLDGRGASNRLKDLFCKKVFTNPKDEGLLAEIARAIGVVRGDIVLDFFAGSGTTGHAAMKLNAEHGLDVNFILVQYPESLTEMLSSAQDSVKQTIRNAIGYLEERKRPTTIAALCEERLRRCGENVSVGRGAGPIDVGFRAFRIDSGNLQDTRVAPGQATQGMLDGLIGHIKDDRTDEDLLFGALLRWGVDITLSVRREELMGRTIWTVDPPAEGEGGAALVACFARPQNGQGGIDTVLADALAAMKPLRALFRDDGFVSDAAKENIHSRFKQRAPDTDVRVL
jgi:adenine-specific DNA-methyltransferase